MKQRRVAGTRLFCSMPVRLALCALLATLVLWPSPSRSFPSYSQDPEENTGFCADCHGDFNGDDYTSLQDGTPWNDNLMDTHRNWVENACTACHQFPGSVPVVLNDSGSMALPNSCVGCHGRSQDAGTDTGQPVLHPISLPGAGLRQHHYTAGVTVCATCHGDANPANFDPVGEDVPPFNYTSGALSPDFNADPCMDNQLGPTGLDNDGDGSYDGADTDCGAPLSTPGEVTQLRVIAHDAANQELTIGYLSACSTVENTIEFGPLSQVSSYNYTGQQCSIGNTGTYVWNYAAAPDASFFVVVGNDTNKEGSYGRASNGNERPEDLVNLICDTPQDLSNPCD